MMNLLKNFFNQVSLIIFLLINLFLPIEISASDNIKNKIIASHYFKKNLIYNDLYFSNIHRQLTIIIFWASWCSNCPDKLLFLENLYQKYQSQGLEIIAINIDNSKNIKNFTKYSKEIGFFNILIKNITRLELPMPASLPDIYLIDKNFNTKRISEIELKSLNIINLLTENNSTQQVIN